jgi:hypothetical protein
MKRRLLLKRIAQLGGVFIRHGANHDVYLNPRTKAIEEVPRHREIDENLAKSIIRTMEKDMPPR